MSIALIAAASQNNVIGNKGEIPWHIPEDMRRFKQLTMGHPVLMGRKTFESIMKSLGKPLPGRTNIVLARESDYRVPESVHLFHSLEDALRDYAHEDIFIIGGGEVYRQTIRIADTIYLTRVQKDVEGDAYFPEISSEEWTLTDEEPHEDYAFLTYKRKSGN